MIATEEQKMEIPLNKTKIGLHALLWTLIFAFYIWLSLYAGRNNRHASQISVYINIFFLIFSGGMAVIIWNRFFKKEPGLVIDKTGLTDNAYFIAAAGRIPWNDVIEISAIKVLFHRSILIKVKNPQSYILRQPNNFWKRVMEQNYKRYETPVCINPISLKIPFDELFQLLNVNFSAYCESHHE